MGHTDLFHSLANAAGQHPLSTIEEMQRLWERGYDMAYAVRRDRHAETRFKRWGLHRFYRTLGIRGQAWIPPNAGDFRLMDHRVVDALRSIPERNRFMKGLYAWVGFKSVGVPYDPAPRRNGASRHSKTKLLALAWPGMTGFSALPLRAATLVGPVLAMRAIGCGPPNYIVARTLRHVRP